MMETFFSWYFSMRDARAILCLLALILAMVIPCLAESGPLVTSVSDSNRDGYFTMGEQFVLQGKGLGPECQVIIGNAASHIINADDHEIIGKVPLNAQTGINSITIRKDNQIYEIAKVTINKYMAAIQRGLGEAKFMLHLFDLDKKLILKTLLKNPIDQASDFAVDENQKIAFLASRNKLIKIDLLSEQTKFVEFKDNITKLKYVSEYKKLFVIMTQGNKVVEVNSRDFEVKRMLSIKRPGDMVTHTTKRIGFITSLAQWAGSALIEEGQISWVDLNSFEIIETLKTGKNPVGINVDQNGKKIVVCDSNQVDDIFEPYKDTISIISIDSRRVTKRFYIAHAGIMELTPDGGYAIIATYSGKKIFFYPLSGERGVDLNIEYKIKNISISSDGIHCFITTRSHPPKLVKIDISSRTVSEEFIIGKYHIPLLVKPASKRNIAYILSKGWNDSQGQLILIDSASALPFQTIAVGHAPGGLDISPTGTKIYVINEAQNTISVVDVIKGKAIDVIPLEQPKNEFWPLAIENVFDRLKLVPTKHLIVAIDYSDKKILFVKTNAGHATKTLPLRFQPAFLEVSPNQNSALVASFRRGNYALVDLNNLSLKKQWHMKRQIHGVSFISNDEIALSHYTPQKGYGIMFVSLSDGTRKVISIEKWVDAVIADSRGEFVYVASSLNGKVYKIEMGKGTKQCRIAEIIEIDGFPMQLELDERNNNLILPNYKFNKLGVYSLDDKMMRSEVDFKEKLVELRTIP